MTELIHPDSREPARSQGSAWEALWIVAVLVALVASGIWWIASPLAADRTHQAAASGKINPDYGRYVGNTACAACHPGETAAHSRSGHALTIRPVARSRVALGLDGKQVEDPERPGVVWALRLHEGKMTAERREGSRVERSLVEYAFGSGHHATTFLSLVDRDPAHPVALEQRLSYYAHSQSLGLTPGQSLSGHAGGNTPSGRTHTSVATLKCFECHVTVTSNRGSQILDEDTMIPNISCERCHGPGKSHVEAARAGASGDALKMPQGPDRWTAAEQMEQCGQCHRTPDMVQPGSIRVDNPVLVRHQPVGLMQSRCYQQGEGRLSCVTCHDPHARTSTDRPGYEMTCLSCHQQPPQVACPVSPRSGCLDCHMPRREVTRGMIMTDHWIRRSP